MAMIRREYPVVRELPVCDDGSSIVDILPEDAEAGVETVKGLCVPPVPDVVEEGRASSWVDRAAFAMFLAFAVVSCTN